MIAAVVVDHPGSVASGLASTSHDAPGDRLLSFLLTRGTQVGDRIEFDASSLRALLDEMPASPLDRPGLQASTSSLVWRFAKALAQKLHTAQDKHGRGDQWTAADWMDECRAALRAHLAKGDPLDVAAYSAFLWHHGEATSDGTDREQPGCHWAAAAAAELRGLVATLPEIEGPTGRHHLMSMLDRMDVSSMSATKINRWLGWIQASLVAHHAAGVEEMKAHNCKHAGGAQHDQRPPFSRRTR